MAAVEVTINGMLYDKLNKTQQNVVLIGEAFLTGYAPGHPLPPIPPSKPPVENPPIIWGPGDPRPQPPIELPPWAGELPKPPENIIDWKAIWTPDTGWAVVGIPNVPHPAPSKK